MPVRKLNLSKAETIDALLKEYELCQSSAYSLEQVIWQTSAVLGLGSIGALLAVAANRPMILVALPIAALSVASSFLWWRVANRWWTIEHLKFARMRHIESELSVIRQTTYVKYLDDLNDTLAAAHALPASKDAEQIRRRLRQTLRMPAPLARDIEALDYQRAGPKEILRSLPRIILGAWLVYLIVDLGRIAIELLLKWI